jgi:hypothetical protein
MEEIMESLLAEMKTQLLVGFLASRMDSNQGKLDMMETKMDSHHKELKALMGANLEQMKACLGATEACLEKRESTPEEM